MCWALSFRTSLFQARTTRRNWRSSGGLLLKPRRANEPHDISVRARDGWSCCSAKCACHLSIYTSNVEAVFAVAERTCDASMRPIIHLRCDFTGGGGSQTGERRSARDGVESCRSVFGLGESSRSIMRSVRCCKCIPCARSSACRGKVHMWLPRLALASLTNLRLSHSCRQLQARSQGNTAWVSTAFACASRASRLAGLGGGYG